MMLLNAPYPPDVRVEKEAKTLASQGILVDIVCNRRKNEPIKSQEGNITIHRIPVPATDQKVLHGIYDAIAAINFIHPTYRKALRRLIPRLNPDVIHVHDLPLGKTGIITGKEFGIPVLLDLHENFPDALKVWFKWKPKSIASFKDKILFTYKRWSKQEAWACDNSDHIIAVVDEMKMHLIEKHGVDRDKISVITNSEKRSFSEVGYDLLEDLREKYKGNYALSYICGIGPHRGVDTFIDGLHLIVKEIPQVKLLLVGSASAGVLPKLQSMVRDRHLENYVQFVGHVPFRQVPSFMKLSDINLVPHNSNSHTENTIPHKLFQIMLLKGNLLVSSCKPLKRIVTKYKSGFVFEADNSVDFANQVIQMYRQPILVSKFAQNGYNATYHGELNWEHTGHHLIQLYRNFLNM